MEVSRYGLIQEKNPLIYKEIKEFCNESGHAKGNFINVGCMMPWMDYTPRTLDEIIEKEAKWHEENPDAF